MEVCANATLDTPPDGLDQLPSLYILVAGAVLHFGVFPFALFNLRTCPIGSTCAILLGSVLLAAFQVISQEEIFAAVTRQENVQFIFMVSGISVIAHLVDRERLVPKVLRKCLKPNQSFETYLLVVCILTFILTALFTSDTCCMILTPALLKLWEGQDRHKEEVDILLLAITTSANLASVTSLFGSVHMALISTRTFSPEFAKSRLDLRTCIMYLLPTAVVTFFLNFAFLVLRFRIRNRHTKRTKLISSASRSDQEMAGLTRDAPVSYTNGSVRQERHEDELCGGSLREERLISPCQLETIPEDEVLEIQPSPSLESQVRQMRYIDDTGSDSSSSDSDEGISSPPFRDPNDNIFTVDYRPSSSQSLHRSNNININMNLHLTGSNTSLDRELRKHGLRVYRRLGVYRSLSAFSFTQILPQLDSGQETQDQTPSWPQSRVSTRTAVAFAFLLAVSMVAVIGCSLASAVGINLNIGLVPVAVATLALVFDTILNSRPVSATLSSLDWSVVILWLATFVWMQGLQATNLPHYLWHKAGLTLSPFTSAIHIAILFAVAMVMSAVFNNVAMTLILLMLLLECTRQLPFVLLLAWLGAVAGNATLFSSVANTMVAHHAKLILSHKLSFWKHLQYAMPTTLLLGTLGVIIISGLLQIH